MSGTERAPGSLLLKPYSLHPRRRLQNFFLKGGRIEFSESTAILRALMEAMMG